MIERASVGFVASGALGWSTVRRRLGRYLRENVRQAEVFTIEDFAGWEVRIPYFRSMGWLRNALSGRRAAQAALRAGYRDLVVATLHNAPFLPRRLDVRYYVYGDATIRQLGRLYGGDETVAWHQRFREAGLRRLARAGHGFVCMSNWYRNAAEAEYGIAPERCVVAPPAIDLAEWRRRSYLDGGRQLQVLFVGMDFERKGGDLVLDVAKDPAFSDLAFDFVSSAASSREGNITFHGRLEQPALATLFAKSDLLVLPTRADCSPNVLIEAGASGIPSIATDVGAIAEIVQDRVTGTLLAKPDSNALAIAIAEYRDDRRLLAARGEAAFERTSSCYRPESAFRPILDLIVSMREGLDR